MLKILGLPISFTEISAEVPNDTVRVQVYRNLLRLALAYRQVERAIFWTAFEGDNASQNDSKLFHNNGEVSIITVVNIYKALTPKAFPLV